MTDTTDAPMVRTPARFFFETGFFAAYAEATIRNRHRPPFDLTDAVIDHAWEIAPDAHPDRAEFDRHLARADSAIDPLATGMDKLRSQIENEELEAAEAVYRAFVANDLDSDGTAEELAACATSLSTYGAHLFPARMSGQVHFARVMMDTVANSIRAYLAKAGDR